MTRLAKEISEAVRQGEQIVDRAHQDFKVDRRAGSGPRMQAWERGELRSQLVPAPPIPIPDGLVEAIVEAERNGRWVPAGAGLIRLREHYDGLDRAELAADEQTWAEFARKHLPIPADRADELLGRMAFRGGLLRCTKCGVQAKCLCACGAPYSSPHRWAAPITQPAAEIAPATALERARAALAADPGKSNRAIAADLGVSFETVRRARAAENAAGSDVSVDVSVDRVGRDGRRRKLPGKHPAPSLAPNVARRSAPHGP
jgi:hypothetical protein